MNEKKENMEHHFKLMADYEKLRHKHILKEIEALKDAGITFYNREPINIKKKYAAK